jgi:hypothetical protein
VKVETLVARGEQLNRELGLEWYQTGAGLKAEPAFQAIYERHAVLQTEEALACARDAGVPALLEWVVDLRVGRRVAPLEERQLQWEQRQVLTVQERQIPYLRAAIDLQNSRDREFRIALDRARAAADAAGITPLRRDRFASERDEVRSATGQEDYVEAVVQLSGMDLDVLAGQARALLAETEDMYRDVLALLVRRRLGVALDALVRADTGWAFRADGYDWAFSGERLVQTATRQMGEMGLDATVGGRVRIDADEREGKQPRAFCVPVRVPEEVYLVLRPAGGHGDYRTFWHELGHAMHFASVDANRPFHERWLGDNSVTEGFAMLWDHVTMEPGWLARYTELGQRGSEAARQMRDLRFELAVSELYMLRRYAAKLLYELVLHRTDYGEAIAAEYADRLTAATLFRYPEEEYVHDVDPGFYCARYLRAWQLRAAIAHTLVERMDEDWYRNPRAGAFVQDLMRRGQANLADQLAVEVTGAPLSFAPNIAWLRAALT